MGGGRESVEVGVATSVLFLEEQKLSLNLPSRFTLRSDWPELCHILIPGLKDAREGSEVELSHNVISEVHNVIA